MEMVKKGFLFLLLIFIPTMQLLAQQGAAEQPQILEPEDVINRQGYEKAAPAIVKIVSDSGRKIGAGVILGVDEDGEGYVLTSYSTVEELNKVAIILKNYPDALLGRVVDKWIDFDLDLAIITIRNFPAAQTVVSIQDSKSAKIEDRHLLIAHTDTGDWLPIEVNLANFDDTKFSLNLPGESGMEGAPIVTEKGDMIGLFSSLKSGSGEDSLSLAIRMSTIKPLINEWFSSVALVQKWEESRTGIATWIWAVGGSVIGGTIVTAIAISGGDNGPRPGLPRAPNPPPIP